jgi:hypothetical protein
LWSKGCTPAAQVVKQQVYRGIFMGQKLKIAGWISIGAVAGALTTVQLQAVARGGLSPLPLEELQQLSAVFGMVKTACGREETHL